MSRPPLIVALGGIAAWFVMLLLSAQGALFGWLVALVAWSAIPLGAAALAMMLVLIPGNWRALYAPAAFATALLLPLALIGLLPVLLGMNQLYAWTASGFTDGMAPFKAAWLSKPFFIIRLLIEFGGMSALAWASAASTPERRPVIAAVGLLIYPLLGSFIGIDLMETLEPHFHSSIYGLIALTGQWLSAVAFLIIIAARGGRGRMPFAASALLVTTILLWGYMHAMQYIVIWSGHIPEEVVWFLRRSANGWGIVAGLIFGFGFLVAFGALLSAEVRSSPRALSIVAAMVLGARLLESLWLILPGTIGWGSPVILSILFASVAMLGAAFAAWPVVLDWSSRHRIASERADELRSP